MILAIPIDKQRCHGAGFTLVELLVSMAVLSLLLMVVVGIVGETGAVVHKTTARASQFQEARTAFESMSRNLSQATLNTYYDYFDSEGKTRSDVGTSGIFVPASYGRQSELRFRSGPASALLATSASLNPAHAVFFQAPLGFSNGTNKAGLRNLLNTWGYYLEFRPDTDRPSFLSGATRYRYRLMEFMQPTEEMDIYSDPSQWLSTAAGGNRSHVLASNIIALVILPKLPSQGNANDLTVDADGDKLAPNYAYDSTTTGAAANAETGSKGALNSKNQLPPVIEITMVGIDEASASRLENGSTPPDFGMDSLFSDAKPDQRREDLATLQETLSASRASFRVFSTEISLPGAKWSREQTN